MDPTMWRSFTFICRLAQPPILSYNSPSGVENPGNPLPWAHALQPAHAGGKRWSRHPSLVMAAEQTRLFLRQSWELWGPVPLHWECSTNQHAVPETLSRGVYSSSPKAHITTMKQAGVTIHRWGNTSKTIWSVVLPPSHPIWTGSFSRQPFCLSRVKF